LKKKTERRGRLKMTVTATQSKPTVRAREVKKRESDSGEVEKRLYNTKGGT
jgi:hypothetical protein